MGDEKRALRWALLGAALQVGLFAGFFNGLGILILLPSSFVALIWIIAGAGWVRRHSLVGGLLLGVVLGVPASLWFYPAYLARAVPTRIAEYQAALPFILAADQTHCQHQPGVEDWCAVRDFLPYRIRRLGQGISVFHSTSGPQVSIQLLLATRFIVRHSSEPNTSPDFCDLGNGWSTNLCHRRGPRLADN
jgi:hypothetical protein